MQDGEIVDAQGRVHQVLVHEFSGSEQSAVRYRKEHSAYKLNQAFAFDNGFPVTAAREFNDGKNVRLVWVQESSGQPFDEAMLDIARQRYGAKAGADQVVRLLSEDSALQDMVEQSFVERLIYGDPDDHGGNFVVAKEGNKVKVQNIDLDYAFPASSEARWSTLDSQGINKQLHAFFSERPFSQSTLDKLRAFLKLYDNADGKAQLGKLSLLPEEIDALLTRTRNLFTTGRFPRATTVPELIASWKEKAPQE